jgi:hypothetical protein
MKMPSAVVLVQICMFVLLISRPTSVKCNVNPPMSSFELYQQEVIGDTASDNTAIITNSPLGFLGVEAQPLTSGASNTSTRVGTVYGTASEKGSGTSNEFVFLVLDFHVDGSFVIDGKSKYVNGTFIVVGAADLFQPTRNLPILGGTGDFLAAKGFVVQSYASGDVTSNVTSIKNEVMYWN